MKRIIISLIVLLILMMGNYLLRQERKKIKNSINEIEKVLSRDTQTCAEISELVITEHLNILPKTQNVEEKNRDFLFLLLEGISYIDDMGIDRRIVKKDENLTYLTLSSYKNASSTVTIVYQKEDKCLIIKEVNGLKKILENRCAENKNSQ